MSDPISAIIGVGSTLFGALNRPKAPRPVAAPPPPTIDTARQGVDDALAARRRRSSAANQLVKGETSVPTASAGGRLVTGY